MSLSNTPNTSIVRRVHRERCEEPSPFSSVHLQRLISAECQKVWTNARCIFPVNNYGRDTVTLRHGDTRIEHDHTKVKWFCPNPNNGQRPERRARLLTMLTRRTLAKAQHYRTHQIEERPAQSNVICSFLIRKLDPAVCPKIIYNANDLNNDREIYFRKALALTDAGDAASFWNFYLWSGYLSVFGNPRLRMLFARFCQNL